MKKFIIYGLILVGIIVVAAGAFALYIYGSDFPTYSVQIPNVKIEYTPTRVERGKKVSIYALRGMPSKPRKQADNRAFDVRLTAGIRDGVHEKYHAASDKGYWCLVG